MFNLSLRIKIYSAGREYKKKELHINLEIQTVRLTVGMNYDLQSGSATSIIFLCNFL